MYRWRDRRVSARVREQEVGSTTLLKPNDWFVSLCHFIDFAGDLRHNPDIFLEHDWLD